jgi:hypothetical protein
MHREICHKHLLMCLSCDDSYVKHSSLNYLYIIFRIIYKMIYE